MRTFTFKTGTRPEAGGEGVQFSDGITVYREQSVNGEWTTPMVAPLASIEEQYGGQAGYEFTWLDKATTTRRKAE